MSEATDYEALAERLDHHAKAQRWAMGHSAANTCEEAATALRQAAQDQRDLDQEMRRVEMVREYALDHIENAEREVGTGGYREWNVVGRGVVGEQLLEIVEARIEEETGE